MGWRERNRPVDCGDYGFWWHGSKSGGYGFYRHPRTTQEKRAWNKEFGRTRRSPRRLIDCYDDIVRTVQRSWKEHRRWQHR